MSQYNRILLIGAFLLAAAATPLSAQHVVVTIVKPQPSQLSGDELAIKVIADSASQIQSVTATVADRTGNLTFNAGENRWNGTLSLAGLARGPLQLTVTAQNVLGFDDTESVTFIHDNPPVVTVTAPMNESVARPEIHIAATCTDDDPAGCVSLIVKDDVTGEIFASGTSSIDQDVTLPGGALTLVFTGTDSAGQIVNRKRFIYSEWSQRLDEFHSVGGRIVDVDAERILYLAPTGKTLSIRDIDGGTDTHIPLVEGTVPVTTESFLTPRGAIFVLWAGEGDINGGEIYEWQDGVLLGPLGEPSMIESFDVEGAYAIWSGPFNATHTPLFIRNLTTGTTGEIANPARPGNEDNDVHADGTVAFWTMEPYNIHRYEDGILTPLTPSTGSHWYTRPRTDSTNTVYRKSTPCCANPFQWTIVHHDGTGETDLTPVMSTEPRPGLDYQVRDGFIAVRRPASPSSQSLYLWRIPPGSDGELISGASAIDVLAEDGEMTFFRGGQRLLSTPASLSAINSQLGRAFRIEEQWYVAIGRVLFTVNDDVSATTTTLEQSSGSSLAGKPVTFTATVGPTEATGPVIFKEGEVVLAESMLSGGTASFTTFMLAPGSHTITAQYTGDQSFASSSGSVTHLVHPATSFGAPTGVSASATGTSQVVVTWIRVRDAVQYELARSSNNGPFTSVGLVTEPPFVDNTVAPNTSYLYKARAIGETGPPSCYSSADPATTVAFTDNPLMPAAHRVKRVHLTELRTAVNAMRASAGLAPAVFTDPALPAGTKIKAVHVQELRTALDQAHAALSLPALPRTDPTLTVGVTPVKAAHFEELRDGCK